MLAFAGANNIFDLELKEVALVGTDVEKRFFYVRINNGKTLLVITPFFGWRKYDLNNDIDIEFIGNWINTNI